MMNASRVVIGTWSLSGDYGPVNLETIQSVLKYAYEKGIREFDTAPVYGNGFMECCLGKIFSITDYVLINTKIGNLPFWGKSFKLKDIRRSVRESLNRLNGLPINILFLHNPRDEINDYTPIIDYMLELKEKGIIKAIGLSIAKGYSYENKLALNVFDVIQEDLNLLYLEPMKHWCSTNTKFMVRSPLASGLLSGNIGIETIFHSTDHRSEWLKGERLRSLLKRVDVIKSVSENINIASLAKRFLFSNNKIDKIIFGVKSKSHIDELIVDLHQAPLDEDLIRTLIDLYNRDYDVLNEEQYKY